MSSGPQACRDDEIEWSDFCSKHFGSLSVSDRPNWDVYSKEASLAIKGVSTLGLTGLKLAKWVILNQQIADIEYIAKTQMTKVEEAKKLLTSLGYKITR